MLLLGLTITFVNNFLRSEFNLRCFILMVRSKRLHRGLYCFSIFIADWKYFSANFIRGKVCNRLIELFCA